MRVVLLALAGLLFTAIVAFAIPPIVISEQSVSPIDKRLALEDSVRRTLLQGLAGILFLTTAYFTWGQLRTSRQQLRLSEQGQVTERFTRAIDQLGSEKLDVRLGGIYALEGLAKDPDADGAAIVEVLTAYVRERSPWPPRLKLAERLKMIIPSLPTGGEAALDKLPPLQIRAADVQAAMLVLGRRPGSYDQSYDLDLTGVDLRKVYLGPPKLRSADLRSVNLQASNLQAANLEGADLEGADLVEADLAWSNLKGANLKKANLEGTYLRGAEANLSTVWPAGFNPEAAGVAQEATERRLDERVALLTQVRATLESIERALTGADGDDRPPS